MTETRRSAGGPGFDKGSASQTDPPGRTGALARLRARGGVLTSLLWSGVSWWSAAVVVFLFPVVFIIDDYFDFSFSPVLPGVVALGLLWIVLPFVLTEMLNRRWRGLEPDRQAAKVNRLHIGGRRAMLVAAVTLLGWFAFGT